MSPEACRNCVSPGDDSWSLGLLLSEVVTGRFVGSRLGRIDLPVHYRPDVVKELINDTNRFGGRAIGKLCEQLLDMNATERLSMAGLLSGFNAMSRNPQPSTSMSTLQTIYASSVGHVSQGLTHGSQKTLLPPKTGSSLTTNTTMAMRAPTPMGLDRKSNTPVPQVSTIPKTITNATTVSASVGTATTLTARSNFTIGQSVVYTARSNGMQYKGTIIARNPNNSVKVRLETGDVKEIDAADTWRLKPLAS
jgi:hypothetical protein